MIQKGAISVGQQEFVKYWKVNNHMASWLQKVHTAMTLHSPSYLQATAQCTPNAMGCNVGCLIQGVMLSLSVIVSYSEDCQNN